ncbi:unnamed protein product [Caenorhabditis nigoni]
MGRFQVLLLLLAVSGPFVESLTTFRVNGTFTCATGKDFRVHVILMEDDDLGSDNMIAVQHTATARGTATFTLVGDQDDDVGVEYEPYLRIIHTCRNPENPKALTYEIPLGDVKKLRRYFDLYNYNVDITNKGEENYSIGGKRKFH